MITDSVKLGDEVWYMRSNVPCSALVIYVDGELFQYTNEFISTYHRIGEEDNNYTLFISLEALLQHLKDTAIYYIVK